MIFFSVFFPYFYLLIFCLLGFYLLGTVFQTGLSVLLRLRLLTVLFRLRLLRHVQNLSRITRMRRICSFTDFIFFSCVATCYWIYYVLFLRLYGAG